MLRASTEAASVAGLSKNLGADILNPMESRNEDLRNPSTRELTAMDPVRVRKRSIQFLRQFGYEGDLSVPLLEPPLALRPAIELENRALALCAALAVSFGFDRTLTFAWLEKEQLTSTLTEHERHILATTEERNHRYQTRIESLFALAWILGHFNRFDFRQPCPRNLVAVFPDLRQGQSSKRFRDNSFLRASRPVVEALDLAYCLQGMLVQMQPKGKMQPMNLSIDAVTNRRLALEWAISGSTWESLSVDS